MVKVTIVPGEGSVGDKIEGRDLELLQTNMEIVGEVLGDDEPEEGQELPLPGTLEEIKVALDFLDKMSTEGSGSVVKVSP